MKLLAAILIAFSCAAIVAAQAPASTCKPPEDFDSGIDDLKGPVKVIRTYESWFVVSEKTGRLEKQPRRLEREIKFEPGEAMNGTGRGTAGDDSTTVQYVCGDSGKVMEEIITTQVHPEHFIPKRYDVFVKSKVTYQYDTRGNKIEEKHFCPNGAVCLTWFYNYDSNNRLIKMSRVDQLGRLEDQSFYEYHADGRPLTETNFNNFCILRSGDFCKGYISSGEGFFYYASKTKYEYDSHGNWIKQIESTMDGESTKPKSELSRITEREITYYPNIQR